MDNNAAPKRKSFRILPPEEIRNDLEKLRKWRPEQLSVRQGLAESPVPVLAGYGLMILILAAVCIHAWFRLPEQIEILAWFGMSTNVYNKAVFLIGAFCIQVFLIYRDIIRRSLSKFLLLVPLLYFFLVIFIIASL